MKQPPNSDELLLGTALPETPPPILRATLQLLRLFDLADAIDLERARACLTSMLVAQRPVVSRGASIEIPQLPLAVGLGAVSVPLRGATGEARLDARLYDLGIVALCIHVPLGAPLDWVEAADIMAGVQAYPDWATEIFSQGIAGLRQMVAPALVKPNRAVRDEDYIQFVVDRLGEGEPASRLAKHPLLLQAALGERKRLSAGAAALATTLSYYEDDLILLTWNTAIIIDTEEEARQDAMLLLEIANAQLLAFRTYGARVDSDLSKIAPRMARMRRFGWWPLVFSSRRFLGEVHSLIADITDTSARVENALQVTEDVYWARVYAAALTVLRVDVFRTGVANGVRVLRETASLLHDEAETAWTSLLEILVIVLIAVELVVALLGLRR
jgi:hypothetical protein